MLRKSFFLSCSLFFESEFEVRRLGCQIPRPRIIDIRVCHLFAGAPASEYLSFFSTVEKTVFEVVLVETLRCKTLFPVSHYRADLLKREDRWTFSDG